MHTLYVCVRFVKPVCIFPSFVGPLRTQTVNLVFVTNKSLSVLVLAPTASFSCASVMKGTHFYML